MQLCPVFTDLVTNVKDAEKDPVPVVTWSPTTYSLGMCQRSHNGQDLRYILCIKPARYLLTYDSLSCPVIIQIRPDEEWRLLFAIETGTTPPIGDYLNDCNHECTTLYLSGTVNAK